MPVTAYPRYTEAMHREEVEDASCFVYEESMVWAYPPPGTPNSEERLVSLQVSQTNLDVSCSILRNILLPLEYLLEDETKTMVYCDKYAFDSWGQFLYHGWRKYNKTRDCYEDENGNKCDDRFHNDSNPTKAYEFGEPMRIMANHRIFPRRIEENPATRAVKTNTLWKLFPVRPDPASSNSH